VFPRKVWPQPLVLFAIAFVMGLIWLGLWAGGVPGRRYAPQMLAVLLFAIASVLAACGTSTSNSSPQLDPTTGTPAGTYSIVVTAASGNASIATTVKLTVN
jgi:hypothetical protein